MNWTMPLHIGAEVVRLPGWLAVGALLALAVMCFLMAALFWVHLTERNERESRWRELARRHDGLSVNPWGRCG